MEKLAGWKMIRMENDLDGKMIRMENDSDGK
jgi:hypothetical protein